VHVRAWRTYSWLNMNCPAGGTSGQMGRWLVGWALTDAEPCEGDLDAISFGKALVGVGLLVGPAHWAVDQGAGLHCGAPAQGQATWAPGAALWILSSRLESPWRRGQVAWMQAVVRPHEDAAAGAVACGSVAARKVGRRQHCWTARCQSTRGCNGAQGGDALREGRAVLPVASREWGCWCGMTLDGMDGPACKGCEPHTVAGVSLSA
jgi:hypothetical protein